MAGYPLPRSLGFLDALPAFQTSLCHSDPPSAAANTSGTEAGSQSSASNWPRICRTSSSSSVVHHHHQFVKLFSGWTENAGAGRQSRSHWPCRTSYTGSSWAPDGPSGQVPGSRWRSAPASSRTVRPGTRVPLQPMKYRNVRYAKALPYCLQRFTLATFGNVAAKVFDRKSGVGKVHDVAPPCNFVTKVILQCSVTMIPSLKKAGNHPV